MFLLIKGEVVVGLKHGFTLIGILAAIAIPNFLSYQLKSKTIEAKTNLAGIKTAELTFSADRSCYLSVQNNGWAGIVLVNGAQIPWPVAVTVETGKTG
jgi:type IV pilus assembly protein PilA